MTKTPCLPSTPTQQCVRCDRYRPRAYECAQHYRRGVLIDGTVVTRKGCCPMFVGEPIRIKQTEPA